MAIRIRDRERVTVRERTETAAGGETRGNPVRKVGPRVREALRAANSVIPRLNGRRLPAEEWVLHGAWSAVGYAAILRVLVALELPLHGPAGIAEAWGLVFACLPVVVLALSWSSTLAFSLGVSALGTRTAQGRVHEALVCPFCRDRVGREGTVVCARPRCGALYHRECFDECSQQYGGCAVYGCSSKRANEVSATGYLFRLARLVVAAFLFPPRLARAIRNTESEGFVSSYRQALEKAKGIHSSTNTSSNIQGLLLAFLGVPASYLLLYLWFNSLRGGPTSGETALAFVWVMSVPFVALFLPFVIALPLALGFYTAKTVARAFQAELGALGRADDGGTTVIGRLRLGLGKK